MKHLIDVSVFNKTVTLRELEECLEGRVQNAERTLLKVSLVIEELESAMRVLNSSMHEFEIRLRKKI